MNDHPRRPIHHSLMAILAAPLAHWHHGRYRGRPWHLTLDTLLNLIIWALIGSIAIYLIARPFSATVDVKWTTTPITSGAMSDWKVLVTNTGHRSVKNVKVKTNWPKNWQLFSDDQEIAEVSRGSAPTVSYSFRPIGRPDQLFAVPVTVSWRVWWQKFSITTIARGKISGTVLDLRLTSNPTAAAGSQFTARLVLKNTAATDLTGSQVKIISPGGLTFVASDQTFEHDAWMISNIGGRQERAINITWRVPTVPRRSYRIVATAFINGVPQVSRSIDVLVTTTSGEKIATTDTLTQPALSAELRYHGASGAQFGFGPLPPRVGKETGYRIFWYVRPGSSTLKNNILTAVLPAGVSWLGNPSVTSGQAITYDSRTRRISWAIGSLSANSGMVIGSFEVAITPSSKLAGQAIAVCGAATWSYTGDGVGRLTAGILKTTDVDGRAAGKGLVKG